MSISSARSLVLQPAGRPDMNLATDSKRILYVLDKAISRAKFVAVLKSLVADDGYLLSNVLNSEDHFYIVQVCRKYEFTGIKFKNRMDSIIESIDPQKEAKQTAKVGDSSANSLGSDQDVISEHERSESLSSDSSGEITKPMKTAKRLDKELSKVILLLEDYPEVHRLAAQIENEISPQMRFFIKCLQQVRDGIALHLGESAAQEKAREAYLRECYLKNEKMKQEIERLETELKEHKTDANYCIIGRNVLINRHQNKIAKIKRESAEAIEKRVKESEKTMTTDWKASTAIQETLREELISASRKFETLLKEDLALEKALRTKRSKVENQLLGWLQKFDQEIGEKQAEEEDIQALLDAQNAELERIRLKLEEQEEVYDELMQEKAEYELEMLERRLIYKLKKLAKKKAKKDKKGKKGKK